MSQKPQPKRHHFVPIMLLRRFTDDEGLLHYIDKRIREKGVLASIPDSAFFERHLYSVHHKDGTKDAQLEHDYCAIEGRAEPVIEKIVTCARQGQRPNLTQQERETFNVFFCTQWQRVPDVRDRVFEQKEIESDLNKVIAGLQAHAAAGHPVVRELLKDPKAAVGRIKQNAMIDAIKRPSPNILAVLKQKGLFIAVIRNHGKSFVIGSQPIVRMGGQISDPTTETWLPIASDVAVTPFPISVGPEVLRDIKDADIRKINRAAYKDSTLIAGRSARLIASLAHTR